MKKRPKGASFRQDAEYIIWKDHITFASSEWRDLADFKDLRTPRIHTIGFVIDETPDELTVVGTIDAENGSACCEIKIIKTTIIHRKRIKL